MITEIEVEGVGPVRSLNMWQMQRAKRVQRPNRMLIRPALACGMEIRQFKRLDPDLQARVNWAYNYLINSANTAEPGKRSVTLEELLRPRRAAA